MNRVREFRERWGISGKDLAEAINVSQSTISDWERQKKNPRGENLVNVAKYFKTTTQEIMGLDPIRTTDIPEDVWAIRSDVMANPMLKSLFECARGAKPEVIRAAISMIRSFDPQPESENPVTRLPGPVHYA